MKWDEFCSSVDDAELIVRRGDRAVEKLGRLMVGRLRSCEVPCHVLEALKKELRDYNIKTGQWKGDS